MLHLCTILASSMLIDAESYLTTRAFDGVLYRSTKTCLEILVEASTVEVSDQAGRFMWSECRSSLEAHDSLHASEARDIASLAALHARIAGLPVHSLQTWGSRWLWLASVSADCALCSRSSEMEG